MTYTSAKAEGVNGGRTKVARGGSSSSSSSNGARVVRVYVKIVHCEIKDFLSFSE
jgi:hypothetical protein